MRRIALYSDIHGNTLALDAAFADMDAAGISERYCLGDLIGYGPDPAGVVDRVRAAGDPTIRGNYDDGVARRAGSCGCYYATDEARADGESSYRFTDAMLDEPRTTWLLARPAQISIEEGDGRLLLVHGSPRKINEYLLLDRDDEQLRRLAADAATDVVCHGHTHVPYHRSLAAREDEADSGTVHYVSAGSVGKPKDGDPRAGWVELVMGTEAQVRGTATQDGAIGRVGTSDVWLGVVVHRVDYDIEAVASAMLGQGLPRSLGDALRNA